MLLSVAEGPTDTLQIAPTGRAKCRACGNKVDKGALRFGEALPSAYGEGDAVSYHWFHPRCAAHRRPEKFSVVAGSPAANALPDRDALVAAAALGIAHHRLPRIAGAELASSGRARCRHCKDLIAQGTWRIRLSSFAETGFFDPMGFVHASCARGYFGVVDLGDRLQQATPGLDDAALRQVLSAVEPAEPPRDAVDSVDPS